MVGLHNAKSLTTLQKNVSVLAQTSTCHDTMRTLLYCSHRIIKPEVRTLPQQCRGPALHYLITLMHGTVRYCHSTVMALSWHCYDIPLAMT